MSPESKHRRLTAKERLFIEEYLKDWNAAGAARRAGYSARSARYIGYENLTKPHISDQIARRSRELGCEVDLKPRDVVEAMRQQLPRIGISAGSGTPTARTSGLTS